MMSTVHLILLVFAFVLFVIAGFREITQPPYPRVNLLALGLACLTLALWLR